VVSVKDDIACRERTSFAVVLAVGFAVLTSAPISLPLNSPAGGQAISLVRGHMTARGHFGRRGRARQAIWTPPREPGLW
jgi:hypothetical protein